MLTHLGTQTIETERLILRRFEYSDIDSMLRIGFPMKKRNMITESRSTQLQKRFGTYLTQSISFRIQRMIITVGRS